MKRFPLAVPAAKQNLVKQSLFKQILSHVLPIVALFGVGALVVGTGALGLQFILEPKSVAWLNDYLPETLQIPLADWDRPHTLEEIKKNLTKGDLTLGEFIDLPNGDRITTISQPRYNCVNRCDRIIELRVYRKAKAYGPKKDQTHYRMVAQVSVPSANDRVILDSLQAGDSNTVEVEEDLPLETFDRFDAPNPNSGNWFNLTGKRSQGENNVTYGQLFHYDESRTKLTALIQWSSPAETDPIVWRSLTNNDSPKLLINQSIGLEPRFLAYNLTKSTAIPELSLISIDQPALKTMEFEQAIDLAKAGLWSLAADRLKTLKPKNEDWPTAAQLQFNFILYHAKMAKLQTQETWTNATQQVLAQVLDGQWKAAIDPFEKDPTSRNEMREGIALEAPRLWKRITAALKDDPGNPYLQAWAARVTVDRDGKSKAIAWVNQQGGSSDRTTALKLLAPELVSTAPTAKPIAQKTELGAIDSLQPPTRFNQQPALPIIKPSQVPN
jgi:hypothetical protein